MHTLLYIHQIFAYVLQWLPMQYRLSHINIPYKHRKPTYASYAYTKTHNYK